MNNVCIEIPTLEHCVFVLLAKICGHGDEAIKLCSQADVALCDLSIRQVRRQIQRKSDNFDAVEFFASSHAAVAGGDDSNPVTERDQVPINIVNIRCMDIGCMLRIPIRRAENSKFVAQLSGSL